MFRARRAVARVVILRSVLALAGILSALPAMAAEEVKGGANLQRFTPAVDPLGAFSVGSGEILRPGGWAVGLHLNYARNPLVLNENGVRIASTLSNVVALQLHGAMNLASFFELGFGLPLVAYQTGNDTRISDLPAQAIGDLELQPRFRLLTQKTSGVGLTVTPGITIPLGGGAALQGDASVTMTPRLSLSHVFAHSFFATDVWFHLRPPVDVLPYVTLGHEFGLRAAFGFDVTENTEFMVELDGAVAFSTLDSGARGNPLEAIAGIRHHLSEEWSLEVGAGAGILSAPGTPDFRVISGLTYGRKLRRAGATCQREGPEGVQTVTEIGEDEDKDLLDDACDICPVEAETVNGYKDGDGCAELDTDGDGVFDEKDLCVKEKGRASDGCPDRDGDDILDLQDLCPDSAGPKPDGCPDRDGDGLADNLDFCPEQAEDKDRFEDDDGCADVDNDKDGLLDTVDRCVLVPEDVDGYEDEDGCPELDNDQDGINDSADKCPLEKETINGVDDTDGCPDKGKTLVIVRKDKIEILDKVYFATDKDVIEKRSFGLLQQVALTIKAHPEIARLRVEGHTDDQGNYAHNVDLSQRRAEAVVRFLATEGVEQGRMTPKGFASDVPIVPNKNATSRATNRRVEFNIISDEAAVTP